MSQLPTEILEQIFFYVRHIKLTELEQVDIWKADIELPDYKHSETDEQRVLDTLLNVSLTCKRFNDICIPALYHTIFQHDMGGHRLRMFVKAISKSSRKANSVRKAYLYMQVPENPYAVDARQKQRQRQRRMAGAMPALFDLVRSCMPRTELQMDIVRAIRDGDEDAETALLLKICPKIECILFRDSNSFSDRLALSIIREAVEHNALSNRFKLSGLREIRLERYSVVESHRTAVRDIMPLLSLPSLEKLCTESLSSDSSSADPLVRVPAGSLKYLELMDVHATYEDIEALLETCPKLLRLSLERFGRDIPPRPCNWAELGKALRKHNVCLEELNLRMLVFENERDPTLLGTLKPLACLQKLDIQHSALLKQLDEEGGRSHWNKISGRAGDPLIEILPTSLTSMKLTLVPSKPEEIAATEQQLITLMSHRAFNRLQKVAIDRPGYFEQDLTSIGWRHGASEDEFSVERVT